MKFLTLLDPFKFVFRALDNVLFRKRYHRDVPLWQYVIFRAQFFLVYFIAALKKMDRDWVGGYAMNSLGHHWVFAPLQ